MRRPQVQELSVSLGRDIGTRYTLAASSPQCGAQATTHGRTYTCTRCADHAGPHVAHIVRNAASATWADHLGDDQIA